MSPSTPADFRLLPSNTHCILSHWNGSSGFSVHSSSPAKRPNTSHSAWQNQLTDQFSSSSASRPSQSVQWCRLWVCLGPSNHQESLQTWFLSGSRLSVWTSLWLTHCNSWLLVRSAASYSVTCSPPSTKEMNLESKTKWNSRDLQNNLLMIPYTIVPPVSYLFPHRRSYHLFFHISIFKCNYLFRIPVFHNPGIPEGR